MGFPKRLLMVLVVLCPVLGGCLAPRPGVEVARVDVIDESSEGVSFRVLVAMENPWNEPVTIGTASLTVSVEGVSRFSDTDVPPVSLPAGGVQTIELRAALPGSLASLAGRAMTARGEVTYTPPGDLRVILTETGVPLPRADFSWSGEVPAAKAADR
ncbi:MAG: LEA type 2 family protein [Phycisphaeraceae bacterium]